MAAQYASVWCVCVCVCSLSPQLEPWQPNTQSPPVCSWLRCTTRLLLHSRPPRKGETAALTQPPPTHKHNMQNEIQGGGERAREREGEGKMEMNDMGCGEAVQRHTEIAKENGRRGRKGGRDGGREGEEG